MANVTISPTNPHERILSAKRISRIVFTGLLLDILSFTIILPLLPRSLEAYKAREGSDPTTLLGSTLAWVSMLRSFILKHSHHSSLGSGFLQQGARADMVLLGGLLGSLYSLLQCLVAPVIGRLADKIGRRRTLMICMLGNIAWTVIWVFAGSFETFLVARVIAGLSEGNVQLSNTIIADVTDPQTRSHGMALVGIAFAIGFTLGPSIGAYFAQLNPDLLLSRGSTVFEYAPFAMAALFSLVLLIVECVYLFVRLPETLHYASSSIALSSNGEKAEKRLKPTKGLYSSSNVLLRRLNYLHFAYLFFFSGMEYTLTFLTHDKFGFTNAQQGKLLGLIGITSTIIQGGYVRRIKSVGKTRDKSLVSQGMIGCAFGLFCIAFCCLKIQANDANAESWLWAGALGLALASATVVNCLNSLVSLVASSSGQGGDIGRRLGDFRSAGQIGRALGPMFACSVYWLLGASTCYMAGAGAVTLIALVFIATVPTTHAAAMEKKPHKKSD
ncbi:hypothetical protein IW140_004317 [Coemansia sp. RSA 1813]|nr:hypothetical protein EV178_004389 [Coemansia sp. RSA 1646]KAJ1767407.1 hypothetical protein LPJ74_005399 [Coemansia sp. RSA 1843]KAJ2087969.1 hypothetical protein IW138_004566 [Coemansia sp. RSA 986]KAJ2211264.1 hypothetical protein EV179_005628 [Coemansia sp. RSA 487]KAJ2567807.1 hypothetical protein IW140_004317 [Coemansia sp. RSA 1813]